MKLPHNALKILAISLFLISGLTLLSTILSPPTGWVVKTPYTILLEGEEGAPPSPPPEQQSPPPEQQGPPPEGMPPEGMPSQGEQPPQMTAEQMYQQLPAEVISAGVTLSDIQSLYSMGVTDPATMQLQLGNLIAEKMAPQGASGGGQGGQAPPCNGPEECQAYCSDPAHAQECQGMGPGGGGMGGQGMNTEMGPTQGEQGGEMREGPGGCKSMSECIAYCKDPAHMEECGRKGPPERKKGGPPPGMVPEKVPDEVVEAGATQDFLNIMCANIKFHISCDFMGAIDAAKTNFSEAQSQLEGLTFNFSGLDAVKSLVQARIDGICASTPENFGTNMKTFMAFMEGDSNPMEASMQGISGQVEDWMLVKAQGLEQQMQSQQTNMEQLGQQMQALSQQMANATPEQQQALQQEMQTLQQQMQGAQGGGAAGQEMQALGNKMEQIFGGMEQKMEAAMQANKSKPECIAMEREAVDAEITLTNKMLNFAIKMIEEQEAELKKYGIEVEELTELKAWVLQQQEKVKTVFVVGATEEQKFAFVTETQEKMKEWEQLIPKAIIHELGEKFIPKAESNAEKYRAGAKYAKSIGKNEEAAELNELATEIEDYTIAAKNQLQTASTEADLEKLKSYFVRIFNADKEAADIYMALKEGK